MLASNTVIWSAPARQAAAAPCRKDKDRRLGLPARSAPAGEELLPNSRRDILTGALPLSLGLALALEGPTPAHAAAVVDLGSLAEAAAADLQEFVNEKQQYRLLVPPSWERKDKAGADVLFEDPEHSGTSVGITVSPVRVSSIDKFGSLEAVGQKLMASESAKESTKSVEMISQASRPGAAGATLYAYEYNLDSTRGQKRILNTVTITDSKLYILNGQYKCAKKGPCEGTPASEQVLGVLRQVAASFDAGQQ